MKIFYTNRKDSLKACIVALAIITTAIILVVNLKVIYDLDISLLNIDGQTGYSREVLKLNYGILVDYLSPFYRGELFLPDFSMSEVGVRHFKDVKDVVDVIYGLWVISTLSSVYFIHKELKEGNHQFIKLSIMMTLVIPLVLGFIASLDFDMAFILFHQIIFNNEDWIFDARYDPVIKILPQDFFMHAFIWIIVTVIVLCLLLYVYNVYKQKKYSSSYLDLE